MVSVISSDSNEEGTNGDILIVVQGFATLNIGEKGAGEKHLVNVEVQTEISIPPKVFVEPSMVDRVLSRTCGVPKNQAKQQEIHVAYFPPPNQPIISKEDTTLLLKKTASKKKSEKQVGTLKEQLSVVQPQLDELRHKLDERMQQFIDDKARIEQITAEILGLLPNESNAYSPATEEDLSLKRLDGDALQRKTPQPSLDDSTFGQSKSISNETLEKLAKTVTSLKQEKKQRIKKLQDLGTSLIEMWSLMGTPKEEQQLFQHFSRSGSLVRDSSVSVYCYWLADLYSSYDYRLLVNFIVDYCTGSGSELATGLVQQFSSILDWLADLYSGQLSSSGFWEKNLDELEWLIRLLTTSDPYPIKDMHPIAQIYPLAQVDYTRLVRFLVLLCEEDDEDIEEDWTDMSHGMTDNDFIYLDDEERGLALGLPPNLFNILFP
ncbi:hypothetical protein L7F22_059378 [Adiantum nelumboides]|nr:hypothetical protein [Adiantum nelumboides]